ncbi:MAG TPA: hypothetical protein ENI51_04190, partial [Candidatus Atribacteria bacterium]|nr:hypothetical protein [Candidatus Atribacteria bacterium]
MILLDLLASAVLGEAVHMAVLKLRESRKDPYKEALNLIIDDLKGIGYRKEIRDCLQNTLLNDVEAYNKDKITDFLYKKSLIVYEKDTYKPNEEEKKEIKKVCEYVYKKFPNAFSFTIKKDPSYELFKILTSITIPPIEFSSYLDKQCIHDNESDLFRPEPKWIDFEQGHFIEREEKKEVLSKLEENNIHVIYGDPSSGKTHFVRYLGYLLLKENNDVYIIDLKEGKIEESYKKDLTILADRDRTVLIIDDAHLDINGVDYIIGKVEGKNLKLIISTRKLEDFQEKQSPHSLLKKCIRDRRFSTELESIDIASRMVDLYSKLKRIEMPEEIKEEIISKYKKDLWFLKWALKVYEEEKAFSEEKLYEKIAEKKFYKYEYEHNKYLEYVGEIFYYISLFSQYEFPVEKRFIQDKIGKENLDKFEKLSKSREFIETEKNRIMLYHSSIARIYLETLYSG